LAASASDVISARMVRFGGIQECDKQIGVGPPGVNPTAGTPAMEQDQ
jgi:hypothetical protein